MKKRLEVVKRDATTWEAFIDGLQLGQYSTATAAKSAIKRKLPSSTPRLSWTLDLDTWTAFA